MARASRFGSGIRPELGLVDYSPIAKAGMAAGQAYAQGIAGLAEGIGQGVESYFKNKEDEKLLDSSVNNIFASAQQRKSVSDYINSRVPESATETEKKAAIRQALVNMAGGDRRAAAAFGYKTIEQLNAQEADQKRQAGIAKSLQGAFDSGVDPLPIAINAGLPIDQALSISNAFVNRQNMTAAQRKAEADAARQAENDRRKAELDEANRLKTEAETRLLNRRLGTPEDTRAAPPAGFEYESPQSTNLRPIPGGPAAIAAQERMAKAQEKEAEMATAEKKAKMAEEQAKTYIFNTLDNISRAKSLIENRGAGGAYEGAVPRVMNMLGRPETMQLIAAYKQIASNVLLDQIYRLKEVSPTGATGLGATSNIEINKLSERLGELNPELPASAQIQILNDVERSLKNLSGNSIIENEYAQYQEELKKQSPIYRQQEAKREEERKKAEEERKRIQALNEMTQFFLLSK
jgi:hypothetical protein